MRIPNRRLLGIAALAGLLAPVAALAQWTSDATIEQFSWREHTSPIEVHETGPRFAAGLAFTQPGSRGFLFGYRGRVWVTEHFNRPAVSDLTLRLYSVLAAAKRPPR